MCDTNNASLKDTIREILTDINDSENLLHLYRVAVRLWAKETDAQEAGTTRETCKLLLDGIDDKAQIEKICRQIAKAAGM